MANFSLPWSHSFDNVRWALDTAVRKLSFSKEKLPNYWDSFCRPPRRTHRDVMSTLREGVFSFSACSYSNAVPKSVTLWLICRRASVHRRAARLENTLCARLWKTAHYLTKGSESFDTFCLSPPLYAWWERQDAEYFPSNGSMIFTVSAECPR